MKQNLIHIGTSGWHYPHWKGPFYPLQHSDSALLSYYMKYFHTAEINNSFYQIPQKKTLELWRNTVPGNFNFSVKASRYITHMKKLKDPHQPVSHFLQRIDTLGNKRGPILFQLPPRWKCNPERLESFLKILPKNYRYTFEFRDPSWFNSQVYEILTRYKASFCIYDLDGRLSPKKITADFVYIRLHGPDGPYQGKYNQKTLSNWSSDFSRWTQQNKEVYCYFDNDQAGFAVQNAWELQELIRKE
ncbi:DUF72 domain-containing protein [bacterium]|nr:DUF72 domain-containing protein [bacterium]